jgi:hypothetical protein
LLGKGFPADHADLSADCTDYFTQWCKDAEAQTSFAKVSADEAAQGRGSAKKKIEKTGPANGNSLQPEACSLQLFFTQRRNVVAAQPTFAKASADAAIKKGKEISGI